LTDWYEKRQWPDERRGEERPRPSLANLLEDLDYVAVFERTKAAVYRPLVVERQTATEIGSLDETHRGASACRLSSREQAVDTAAEDEHIEGLAGQAARITDHRAAIVP
jgi:hypothetical protein